MDRLLILFELGYVQQYNDDRMSLHWPNVYMIDQPAIDVLLKNDWEEHQIITLHRKQSGIRSPNFDHDFAAANVVASIQVLAPKFDRAFIPWNKIFDRHGSKTSIKLPFSISHRFPNGSMVPENDFLKPDANGPFGLMKPNGKTSFFAHELETGQNPVEPTRDLKRASTLKKVLAYTNVEKNRAYVEHWGIRNLRTLFVTEKQARLTSMLDTTSRVIGPTNQFLFLAAPIFKHAPLIPYLEKELQRSGMEPTLLMPE